MKVLISIEMSHFDEKPLLELFDLLKDEKDVLLFTNNSMVDVKELTT